MPKKGLSFEEKRRRLLAIFYEQKTVFHLKELEKEGPKRGIIPQSVKDVLKSLEGDGLVESDKIGAGTFYWALPSRAAETVGPAKARQKELEQQNAELEARLEEAKTRTVQEDPEEREQVAQELAELKETRAALAEELQKYERLAPERLDALRAEAKAAKDETNEWVDRLFIVQQFLKKMRPDMRSEDWEKQFPVLKDLDYED